MVIKQKAYQACIDLATEHYENFPVASWLLPKHLRAPIAAIYAFARVADDIADEGEESPEIKQQQLKEKGEALLAYIKGEQSPTALYDIALLDTIERYQLESQLFLDLLSAFSQDTYKLRYENFGELMDYCRRSANPIGRLLLQLQGYNAPRLLGYSDAICSALQLINFYQDLSSDYHERGRLYIPLDEMTRFQVTEEDFAKGVNDFKIRNLLFFQYERAEKLLASGSPLGIEVKGRFAFELRMIILAGQKVIQRLAEQENLFSQPRLKKTDYINIVWKALWVGGKKYGR